MRRPLAVEVPAYDLKDSEPDVNKAVQAFADYIGHLPRAQNTRSKYGLMGSAGKALSELKAGRRDRGSLLGYTLRVQESSRAGQYSAELTPLAMNSLELAVDTILDVLAIAPPPYHAAIFDRLDYGLFYNLRRAQMEHKEVARRQWIEFLLAKYQSAEALSVSWQRTIENVESLSLQAKVQRGKQTRSASEQADTEAFYSSRNIVPIEEEQE